jgi:hypothetical protein
MLKHSLISCFASAAIGAGTLAAATPTYEPLYIFDGQYTATLKQHSHRWQLQPLRGDEVEVTTTRRTAAAPGRYRMVCGSSARTPRQPQLVAPSVTALPAGFPQHVAMRACGEKADGDVALYVPAVALNWINANVGSVLIDD